MENDESLVLNRENKYPIISITCKSVIGNVSVMEHMNTQNKKHKY